MAEHGPVLSVHPSSCLVDEKTEVEVKHLPADYKITLHALIHSEDGDDWEAFGRYTSDSSGTVKGTLLHLKQSQITGLILKVFTEILIHSFQR